MMAVSILTEACCASGVMLGCCCCCLGRSCCISPTSTSSPSVAPPLVSCEHNTITSFACTLVSAHAICSSQQAPCSLHSRRLVFLSPDHLLVHHTGVFSLSLLGTFTI